MAKNLQKEMENHRRFICWLVACLFYFCQILYRLKYYYHSVRATKIRLKSLEITMSENSFLTL